MHRTFSAAVVLVCIASNTSAVAEDTASTRCQSTAPEPFTVGQPFLLNDPRTGLMLYVESDGRHVTAITRDGKVRWHRNLFDDPRLASELVPRQFPGLPPPSAEAWQEWAKQYLGSLSIDRIGVVPDCGIDEIDHHLPPQFRGHFIFAGSGTHIEYLLDARTGDMHEYVTN